MLRQAQHTFHGFSRIVPAKNLCNLLRISAPSSLCRDFSDQSHELTIMNAIPFRRTPMYTTDQYEGVHAETVSITGANGESIKAYLAPPAAPRPRHAIV